MNDENEATLVRKSKRGDEKAFNHLVFLYRKRIYDLVYRMVRNHQDAADLSMEVFVKAYRGLKDFEERSSFYGWLTKIAVNLCINFYRREKFRWFLSLLDLGKELAVVDSPAEKMEKKELQLAIDRAVKSLPPRQRITFVLRFYEHLPYQEIAEILGITEGAAKANYFQAIQKLKKFLAPYV